MHFVFTFLCNKLCQKSTKTLGVTGDINNRGKKECKKVHIHETKIPLSKTDFPDKEVRPNTLELAWVTK